MKGPTAPPVGSGEPASRTDWVVESSTSILRREPWIEVFEEHIRLPNGGRVDDFYTVRLPDFVMVAATTDDGHVVMVHHYRHGPRRVTYSLPSGFIESDESPADAARRELMEETGYESETWSDLGRYVVDGNRRCGIEHVFVATGARRVADPASHDLAETTVELMTTEDAIEKLWRGDISELPSAAGLALALLKQHKTAKSIHGA